MNKLICEVLVGCGLSVVMQKVRAGALTLGVCSAKPAVRTSILSARPKVTALSILKANSIGASLNKIKEVDNVRRRRLLGALKMRRMQNVPSFPSLHCLANAATLS
ncbi:MAG: hypothetical protein V4488_05920 [Pseudomonadota bacterium]